MLGRGLRVFDENPNGYVSMFLRGAGVQLAQATKMQRDVAILGHRRRTW